MGNVCPDCGAEVELIARAARLQSGNCAACGHRVMLVTEETGEPSAGSVVPSEAPAPASSAGADEVGEVVVEHGPPCPSCGGALELSAGEDHRLSAICADCDSEFTYVLKTEREERAPRREAVGRESEEGRQGAGPARPCRKCGEPLRFSTNPDGTVTGICDSCGNRFTLPPRKAERWDDRRRGGFRPREDRRAPRSGGWSGGPRRGSGYGPRSSGPPRGRPQRRRRERRDDDSD